MYLKDLSISGFKSFAKKGELEFSSAITAIVGPNGSGKSNVAEAFRFVLGEQSLKSMRSKRGEDMIFNGSDKASRANRASVAITLDNSKRIFPVDFDEVRVERVVHRDGQNEYSINGSKVRLKDVQEILAAANIGPTGHHIISQGEADRILSSTSKERREMIEDALGLKVYQYKKNESEKKLKKTKENIGKVESLRREVAPHLKFLAGQVKKIEQSIKLREELIDQYAEYLKREDVYLSVNNARLLSERKKPAAELISLAENLRQAKMKLEQSEKDEKRADLIKAEESLSATRNQRQELSRKLGQIEGQESFLLRRIENKKNKSLNVEDKNIRLSEVQKLIDGIDKEVSTTGSLEDVSILKRILSNITHQLKRFIQENKNVEEQNDFLEEETELEKLKSDKEKLSQDLNKIQKEELHFESQYNAVRQSIEAEVNESREAERAVFEIVSQQKDCELKLERIDQELSINDRNREEFKRELQEAVALVGRGATVYHNYEIKNGDKVLSNDEVVSEDRTKQLERRRQLERKKVRLEELGGANEDIEKEYKEVKERDEFLVREIEDLNESVVKLEELIADLKAQLNQQFVAGIKKIDTEFSRFFTLMFGGGSASLKEKQIVIRKQKFDEANGVIDVDINEDDVDESEPEVGIEIDVKLPNKRVSGLEMLSGGERALTSIALIFAMSQVNPPLFVILDETDAALDEANSRRYGDMIEALAEKSQLILITHNRETMGRAGVLYGVTMAGDGVSKLLSVKLEEAVKVAK